MYKTVQEKKRLQKQKLDFLFLLLYMYECFQMSINFTGKYEERTSLMPLIYFLGDKLYRDGFKIKQKRAALKYEYH